MKHEEYTKSPGLDQWSPEVWAMLVQPRPWRKLKQGDIEIETHPAALEYCLREGVVGLGWNVGEFEKDFETFDEYLEALDGKFRSPTTFGRVKPGDLVWLAAKTTKPLEGPDKTHVAKFAQDFLYLALVVGPWEYRQTPLGWVVDIVAVAPSLIKYVGLIEGGELRARVELSEKDRELVHQLWEGYLTKRGTVSPIYKLGHDFTDLSKRVWAQLVKGANPAFREVPPIPPVETLDPML